MDKISKNARSALMARVKGKDSKPELIVRSALHKMGYRFRLHPKELPGSPDIVLPRYKTVLFVHGCFWHRHKGCRASSTPQSNQKYWMDKFIRNVERDKRNRKDLIKMGWHVFVIWECDTRDGRKLNKRIAKIDKILKFKS